MTVDILIRDYNPPRCFQMQVQGVENAPLEKILARTLLNSTLLQT
jgi:hypothetical protein